MKQCPTCKILFKKYGATFCSRTCYEKSRNMKVELFCKWCKEAFYKRPGDIKKNKSGTIHFCSRKCWKDACNYWNTKVELTCKICSSIYKVKKSKENTSNFCSYKCAKINFDSHKGVDENNPNYRHGQRVYRRRAFETYKAECFICGFNKKLHVHHINESHQFNEITNLRILCQSCHRKIHIKALPDSCLFDRQKIEEHLLNPAQLQLFLHQFPVL